MLLDQKPSLRVGWQITCNPQTMSNSTTGAPQTITPSVMEELRAILPERQIITGEKTEKYAKDFYWYSPVLKEILEDKKAEVALLIDSRETLKEVVRILFRGNVPIMMRGGGTGNYGQLIPLYGGAVLDVTKMDKIFSVEGVVHAEAGANLRKIEIEARKLGWELRCMPSTWVSSSIGGFLCGGSVGIGSVRNGGIAYQDTVKSVTLMTVEEEPQLITFHERDCLKAIHTYGTTGILVELEMRLAKAYDWQQLIFVHEDWDHLLQWTYETASQPDMIQRLVTVFEDPIPAYFTPLEDCLPQGKHCTFFMVDESQTAALIARAEAAGIELVFNDPFGNPPEPPYITNYTWNHTTLWALKKDPRITYLQCGFGKDFAQNIKKIKDRFGDEFLMHLEFTLENAKLKSDDAGLSVGGIPLIRYTTKERLDEMMEFCASIGVGIANPHTYILEEGGEHADIADKRALKARVDPKAIMNPGKMSTYPINPFAK